MHYRHLRRSIKQGLSLSLVGAALLLTVQAQQKNYRDQSAAVQNTTKSAKAGNSQTTSNRNFPTVKIKNFGQMDQRFYRGAQPKADDYQSLKALGIKTVIDLRDDPTNYEKAAVEALGMKYVNIPMSDKKYPPAASIAEFLKLANNPQTGAFFVHCEGGRHRTGVIGAVYRLTKYGWDFNQTYEEMKSYDFYTRWGHEAMKDFVVDYAAQINIRKN